MTSTEYFDRALYPKYVRNWDDHIFRERVMARLDRDSMIMDLGAGAGIVEQMNFKGLVRSVYGVDIDPRVVENPMLDEGRISDGGALPYGDDMFDLVFSDNVVEHLANPLEVFQEVFRVLRPGGIFLFKTPNKTHYMPGIARLTPHRFHQFVNRLRGRQDADTFPTLYRANTVSDVRRLAANVGFNVTSIERIEGRPEYLRMSSLTYILGAAYERIVNSSKIFEMFRILLIAELQKPSQVVEGTR